MSVKIWIGGEFENTGEGGMVSDVIQTLRASLEPLADQCHILCNISIPGYPRPKGQEYFSHLDMAVVRNNQFVILELKNYNGRIYRSDAGWRCECGDGTSVEVKGGKDGRTPEAQVTDYRNQMVALLETNAAHFLKRRQVPFDFRRYISGFVVLPDASRIDAGLLSKSDSSLLWLRTLKVGDLSETICQFGGGRDARLDDYEIPVMIERVLRLKPAQMVGNMPMVAAGNSPASPAQATKVVTVKVPVEVIKHVQVREEYGAISSVWNSNDSDHDKAQQFAKLFKRFIWNKIRETYKDTAVKSVYSGIVNLFRGDSELLEHAERLRRMSNAMANEGCVASEADKNESFKTLCLMVRNFYGQDIPAMLAADCSRITYRGSTRFSAEPRRPVIQLAEVVAIDNKRRILTCVSVSGSEDHELKVMYDPAPENLLEIGACARVGDKVCLVTPVAEGDCLRASEIVLEPDYLVSPQKLGSALDFSRPEVYFWLSLFEDEVKRARSVPGGGPLTLAQCLLRGNFANLCLADYCSGRWDDTAAHFQAFFHSEPLGVTASNPNREWTRDCAEQDANLRRVITQTLPNEHHVNPGSWQMEAPLYSPAYGLAARADAIAYAPDGKSATVLELKSGKWDTFRGDRPRVDHAVQPLLYGDLLFFSLGIERAKVNQLLFYSKTIPEDQWNKKKQGKVFTRGEIESVMPGGRIGRALRHISMVRNGIVAVGAAIRAGTFRQIIESCKADDFRPNGVNDRYWSMIRPQIEDLLTPLLSADELTKRYFYRQFAFLAEEEYQARLGEKGADVGRGGSSSLWRMAVADRQKAGLRLSELKVERVCKDGRGRIGEIMLDTSRHSLNTVCSIRAGDSVCLYKSTGGDENITNRVIFAADVAEIRPGHIVLSLQDPQAESLFGFGNDAVYAVEPTPSTTSAFGYSGLRHFISGDPRRRRLVLNVDPPSVDIEENLPIPRRMLALRYPGLDTILVNAWKARDWYLLWGPPGTGKTNIAMRALVDLAMANPETRILLLAYTYRATDEICRMLERRLGESGQANDVYLRLGNPLKCDPNLRGRMAETMGFPNRKTLLEYLGKVRIVIAPVFAVTPGKPVFQLFNHFDMAIVDEASQLLDSHILPLFCATSPADGKPLVGKFIFIGDDRQLPAVVQQSEKTSRVDDEILRERGILNCRQSFFQRLRAIAGERGMEDLLCGLLARQFRMHPLIADFCNNFFYDCRLLNGDRPHQAAGLPPVPDGCDSFESYTLATRLGFYPVESKSHEADAKVNAAEADVCSRIIAVLMTRDACPDPDSEGKLRPRPYLASEIGVVVPFRNQIATIRNLLGEKIGCEPANDILVDTVERFQGGERPVMLFSTVIQNAYQADLLSARKYDEEYDGGEGDGMDIDRKLNVAVTRSKERFYIVGRESVLRQLRAYGDLLEWISKRTGFCAYEEAF